jgi:hypothetical protein
MPDWYLLALSTHLALTGILWAVLTRKANP